ncbi:hypothetical protein N2152v2_007710 [Parachlorella kessleri]
MKDLLRVDVYTAYHNPERCFEETVSGLFTVTVAGGWFPRNFLGRLHAVSGQHYDVIFVDQVSAVIPVLKRLVPQSRVLFYCHFPDMLLAQRQSVLRKAYRAPIDWVEQSTTGRADKILVNSQFTQGVFAETFTRLHTRSIRPEVLYPAVALPSKKELAAAESWWHEGLPPTAADFVAGGATFLSINRFERKKGIGLAIEALHALLESSSTAGAKGCRLVVAGGYDSRLAENVEHLLELQQLASELGVQDKVQFLPSFTDAQRTSLLAACVAVVYTPQNEHFGIVPLEAMAAGRPVLAVNSGGPRESVVDGQTGFLREPQPQAFADAMGRLLETGMASKLGEQARAHVEQRFSRTAFGNKLDEIVKDLAEPGRKRKKRE